MLISNLAFVFSISEFPNGAFNNLQKIDSNFFEVLLDPRDLPRVLPRPHRWLGDPLSPIAALGHFIVEQWCHHEAPMGPWGPAGRIMTPPPGKLVNLYGPQHGSIKLAPLGGVLL